MSLQPEAGFVVNVYFGTRVQTSYGLFRSGEKAAAWAKNNVASEVVWDIKPVLMPAAAGSQEKLSNI